MRDRGHHGRTRTRRELEDRLSAAVCTCGREWSVTRQQTGSKVESRCCPGVMMRVTHPLAATSMRLRCRACGWSGELRGTAQELIEWIATDVGHPMSTVTVALLHLACPGCGECGDMVAHDG